MERLICHIRTLNISNNLLEGMMGKRKVRHDHNSWKFPKERCPYCNVLLAGNWLMRHIRKAHTSKVVSVPVLVRQYDQKA